MRAGRRKLVVELAADHENALATFSSLGFTGESLLRDHIRDRNGELHDLVMLAHLLDGMWAGMGAIGRRRHRVRLRQGRHLGQQRR